VCLQPNHARFLGSTNPQPSRSPGTPLDQFAGIAWDIYCPIKDLAKFLNEQVTACGLIIQDRLFSQVTGDTMKFLTICDYSGMVECKIFADVYRRFGINTVRFPAVELTATVTPFDNGLGYSLQVERVGKPRQETLKCAS
jgi:DNA polymerase III alpha subunit